MVTKDKAVNVSNVDISPTFAPRMSDKDRLFLPEQAARYLAIDCKTDEKVYAVRMDKQFYVDPKVMANGSLVSGQSSDFLIQYGEGPSKKFKIASEKTLFFDYKILNLERNQMNPT